MTIFSADKPSRYTRYKGRPNSVVLAALLFHLAPAAFAQQTPATPAPPATSPKPAVPANPSPEQNKSEKQETKKEDPRTPNGVGNPLLLSNPKNSAPPTLYYDRNGKRTEEPRQGQSGFEGYRRGATRNSFREADKELAYFAYNFFEYPRQVILARRAYLQRQYDTRPQVATQTNGVQGTTTGTANPVPPPTGLSAAAVAQQATGTRSGEQPPTGVSGISPGIDPTGSTSLPANRMEAPGGSSSSSIDAFRDFADPLSQLMRNVSASVPAGYLLAPGDRLTIRYSSPTLSNREMVRTVDSLGNIVLEGIGRINVVGQTLDRTERILTRELTRLYRNVRVDVSLSELRTISVTITGDAFSPGTYTIPSVATAFNVLYAAGGPTEQGTLRRIEVLRRGASIGRLDFYAYLTGRGKTADITLQSGDIINIPGRFSRVAVQGEVRRPAIFELRERETLRDALRYAGGVKASGVDQRVQLSTVEPGAARILRDIDLRNDAQVNQLPLYDGDAVEVFSVRSQLANSVTIEGAVDQPGDYALSPSMTVRDLIRRARGTLSEAYLTRADIYRWQPDNTLALVRVDLEKAIAGDPSANVPLQRWDRLHIYSRQEVEWTGRREVTVKGAVQRPGVYDRSEGMHIRDLLLTAGGPTPEAFLSRAYLLHQRPDTTFVYQQINITEALKGDANNDVVLEDNDVLAIYRSDEAQFQPEHIVAVSGEVISPGIYPRGEGMKLSELIRLAGGFKPSAAGNLVIAHARRSLDASNAVEALRPPVTVHFDRNGMIAPGDDQTLEDGDVVTIQSIGGFKERVELVYVRGAVARPGPVVVTSNKMHLSEAIAAAGGLRPEAFPEGTAFERRRELITSGQQKTLTTLISQLNDILNRDTFQREQAKADVERLKAVSEATSSNSNSIIPGFGGATTVSPTTNNLAQTLPPRDLVSPPRVLTEEELVPGGNLAVNLPDALRRPKSSDDVILLDGDVITIPETPSTVQVVGAVINGRGIVYKSGASADYYIERTGGYTNDAAKDRVVVIRYGGGILPLSKAKEIRPGDIIMVPTKVLAAKIASRRNEWESFIRSLTGAAITVRVLDSLFR